MTFYILLLIIPLLIYATLSTAIIYHLKKYGIAGDLTQKLIIWFFVISIVLIFLTTWSFFNVPWNEINLSGMIPNTINNNPFFNQQY